MNETDVTQQAYADLKAWLESHGGEIAEVAKAEGSALYGEIIAWGVTWGLVEVAIGFALLCASGILARSCYRCAKAGLALPDSYEHLDRKFTLCTTAIVSGAVGAMVAIPGTITLCDGLYTALFALTAPRLYVLDQITSLL